MPHLNCVAAVEPRALSVVRFVTVVVVQMCLSGRIIGEMLSKECPRAPYLLKSATVPAQWLGKAAG